MSKIKDKLIGIQEGSECFDESTAPLSNKKIVEKAIYLHQNGELIEKPSIVYKMDSSYFSSPLVMKVWYFTKKSTKEDIKLFLKDAIIKGALPLEVKRVGLEHGLKEKDINKIWKTRR